jgi:hypothetical protein
MTPASDEIVTNLASANELCFLQGKIQLCSESVLSFTWQKTNKVHYEVLRQILSILLELHMMLTWCATAALKESFQTFPDLLIRRYKLG